MYGNERWLWGEGWLEEEGLPYVLAVKSNEPLWAATPRWSGAVGGSGGVGPEDIGRSMTSSERRCPALGGGQG